MRKQGALIPHQQVSETGSWVARLFQTVAPSPQDSKRWLQCAIHCLFAKNVMRERDQLPQFDELLDVGLDLEQIGQDRQMSSSQRAPPASPKAVCKREGAL